MSIYNGEKEKDYFFGEKDIPQPRNRIYTKKTKKSIIHSVLGDKRKLLFSTMGFLLLWMSIGYVKSYFFPAVGGVDLCIHGDIQLGMSFEEVKQQVGLEGFLSDTTNGIAWEEALSLVEFLSSETGDKSAYYFNDDKILDGIRYEIRAEESALSEVEMEGLLEFLNYYYEHLKTEEMERYYFKASNGVIVFCPMEKALYILETSQVLERVLSYNDSLSES